MDHCGDGGISTLTGSVPRLDASERMLNRASNPSRKYPILARLHNLKSPFGDSFAETEGFEPSEPFDGLTSLAKRYIRPL